MGGVAAVVTTVVATVGAVALYRFVDAKRRELRDVLAEAREATASAKRAEPVIDYERDRETGVYRPKS